MHCGCSWHTAWLCDRSGSLMLSSELLQSTPCLKKKTLCCHVSCHSVWYGAESHYYKEVIRTKQRSCGKIHFKINHGWQVVEGVVLLLHSSVPGYMCGSNLVSSRSSNFVLVPKKVDWLLSITPRHDYMFAWIPVTDSHPILSVFPLCVQCSWNRFQDKVLTGNEWLNERMY